MWIERNIKDILALADEMKNKYTDGSYIEVEEYQKNYDWFYMPFEKAVQKYIFDENSLSDFYNMYRKLEENRDYTFKFVETQTSKMIEIFLLDDEDEIATYLPDIKVIQIEKYKLDKFNKIKNDLYSIFIIKSESYFEVMPYIN